MASLAGSCAAQPNHSSPNPAEPNHGKSRKVPVKDTAKTHKGLLLHVRQNVLPKQLDEFARRDITISPGLIEFHTERLFNLYLKALNEARKDKNVSQKIKLATYFDSNGYLMVKKI